VYRPGELDQRIDLYSEILTDDGFGGKELSLRYIDTEVYSKVRPLSGKEVERFDKLNAESLSLFVIRYRDDIQANDRIKYEDEEYNIRYIPPRGGRAMYLEMYAERGVAQ
jgi:SPP1 family predicted phage head-tail adaptor